MEKPVIEVLGHQATIEGVKGQLADGIWSKEDYLLVWVSFEPYVANCISTAVELPVRSYGRDELLKAVKAQLEEKIPRFEAEHREELERMKQKERRQEDLNSLAKQLEDLIST